MGGLTTVALWVTFVIAPLAHGLAAHSAVLQPAGTSAAAQMSGQSLGESASRLSGTAESARAEINSSESPHTPEHTDSGEQCVTCALLAVGVLAAPSVTVAPPVRVVRTASSTASGAFQPAVVSPQTRPRAPPTA